MHVDDVPARIVVDASVALKWVLDEEESDRAEALSEGRELLTSALLWAEAGNAIAESYAGGRRVTGSASGAAGTRPLNADVAMAALNLACDLTHSIYDCCYLALAIQENSVVVTADRRFRSAVAEYPSLADRVLLLRDIVLH